MSKRLLALLILAALVISACSVEAREGLMEATFNEGAPLSKTITVDVGEEITHVKFYIQAQLSQGSATVYVNDPQGNPYTLALGLTDSTQVLEFDEPVPGEWSLVVYVDGNSETVVEGTVRLEMNQQ